MRVAYWPAHVLSTAQSALARVSYGIVNYRHPIRRQGLEAVRAAERKAKAATTPLECVELYRAVASSVKIPGDMAEVGVYQGGTAAIMLSAAPGKRLHLFDTFSGLPQGGEGMFRKGDYAGSLASVKRNLADDLARIDFYVGVFPEDTAEQVRDVRFSFVHLDMDLYDGTLAALRFFWPRLNPGGILLSHDYPLVDGVVRAFHDFFDSRPEPFIPLTGNQCVAVKLSD